jgi:hypothetical protein
MTVVCGVIARSNEGASVAGWTDAGDVDPLVSARNDPTSLLAFCCGDGVAGAPRSYCNCPIWQAAREAEWARRKGEAAMIDREAQRRDLSPAARELSDAMAGGGSRIRDYVGSVEELDFERSRG